MNSGVIVSVKGRMSDLFLGRVKKKHQCFWRMISQHQPRVQIYRCLKLCGILLLRGMRCICSVLLYAVILVSRRLYSVRSTLPKTKQTQQAVGSVRGSRGPLVHDAILQASLLGIPPCPARGFTLSILLVVAVWARQLALEWSRARAFLVSITPRKLQGNSRSCPFERSWPPVRLVIGPRAILLRTATGPHWRHCWIPGFAAVGPEPPLTTTRRLAGQNDPN